MLEKMIFTFSFPAATLIVDSTKLEFSMAFLWRYDETPHRIHRNRMHRTHRSANNAVLDMTQYKVVKGKRLGPVLVEQFSRAQPGWRLGRGVSGVCKILHRPHRRFLFVDCHRRRSRARTQFALSH